MIFTTAKDLLSSLSPTTNPRTNITLLSLNYIFCSRLPVGLDIKKKKKFTLLPRAINLKDRIRCS